MSQSIGSLIAWVRDKGFNLSLSTERLAFVFALNEMSADSDKELQENDLKNAYRIVNEEFNLDSDVGDTKFNNLIDNLVSQRLLIQIRVNSFDEACYRLSPLGMNLAEAYVTDHELSKIKVTIQLSNIALRLFEITEKARLNLDIDYVYNELQYGVLEDLSKVDSIQRNMDEEQNEVKLRIRKLLDLKWTDAIDEVTEMLGETASKIQEVSSIISLHSDKIDSHLLELGDLLEEKTEHVKLYEINEKISNRIERICHWSERSFKGWKGYDDNLLDHIRKLTNVDSNRILSENLMKAIASPEGYGLCVMDSEKIISLKATTLRNKEEPVRSKLRPQQVKAASEIPPKIDELVRVWINDNVSFDKDINIAVKIGQAINYFETHEPMAVAACVVDVLQDFKRPANSLRKPVWESVEGLGEIKAKPLERVN